MRRRPWRWKPIGAPTWAVAVWEDAIRAAKESGKQDQHVRAIAMAAFDDLTCLIECLRCPNVRLDKAWRAWYPTWVADLVGRICGEEDAGPLADQYSRRAIRASLPKVLQKLWDSYKKLKSRSSRSAGIRNRQPSAEKMRLIAWEVENQKRAKLLAAVVCA